MGSKRARAAEHRAEKEAAGDERPIIRSGGRQNFQIRVTKGHEAEARAAQLRKKPNRVGMAMLRLLGYRNKG